MFARNASVRSWAKEASRVLANTFGRNLTGIERAAKAKGDYSVLRAARKSAGSEASFTAMAQRAVPRIRKAFGGVEANVQRFYNYLAEGSLRGARQRYGDLREELVSMPDPEKDLPTRPIGEERPPILTDPKVLDKYLDVLRRIEGRRRDSFLVDEDAATEEGEEPAPYDSLEDTGKKDDPDHFSNRLVATAEALASNGDYQGLRLFLAGAFDDAAQSVGVMHDFAPSNPAKVDFDAYGETPEVKSAMTAYREEIGNPLTEAFRANKGEESRYVGPLDTYFPLIPHRPEGSGYPIAAPHAEFAPVTNPGAQFKTGLAERYDTSQEAFLKSAERSMRANNRGALINTLQDAGLVHVLKRGTRQSGVPATMSINGVEVPARPLPYKGTVTFVRDGKTIRIPSQHVLVPDFVADELAPILEKGKIDQKGIKSAMGKLTQAAIIGPNAAVIHAHNLLGGLVAGTPFVGKGFGRVPGSIPGLKLFSAIAQVSRIDPTSPARAADVQLLGRLGQLHPKTGTATSSRATAATTGAKFAPQSAFLYGMRGLDLRTRLALLDIARAMHEEAGTTPAEEDLFDFVSMAGTYTKGLDSGFERVTKGLGIAPFVTAGKTALSVGGRALTGTTRLPSKGLPKAALAKARAMQLLSGGIAGYTGLWLAINYLYNGKLPGRDDKFGRIRIKPEDRNSALGQRIFGAGSDPKSVNLAFFNPMFARGTRDFGAEAYANGMLQKKTPDAIVENMQRDIMNGLASPLTTSPTVRVPSIAATGYVPYITSLSRPKPYHPGQREADIGLIDEVGENEVGAHRFAMKIKEAAFKANPVVDAVTQIAGIGHRRPDRETLSSGRMATEMILDLAFPRLEAFEYPRRPGKKPPPDEVDKMMKKADRATSLKSLERIR